MNTELIERLAREAGMETHLFCGSGSCVSSEGCNGVVQEHLERFAALVAEICARTAMRAASADHARMLICAAFPMPKD